MGEGGIHHKITLDYRGANFVQPWQRQSIKENQFYDLKFKQKSYLQRKYNKIIDNNLQMVA